MDEHTLTPKSLRSLFRINPSLVPIRHLSRLLGVLARDDMPLAAADLARRLPRDNHEALLLIEAILALPTEHRTRHDVIHALGNAFGQVDAPTRTIH